MTFKALFRRNDIRALRSGDKGVSVTFEIDNPDDELIDQLNRLHRPDATVNVGVWA